MSQKRIGGLVLAAGRSSRMGHPKPELQLDGRSFLEHCIEVLRAGGCDPVVAVVAGAPPTGAGLRPDVLWAQNPDPGSEPIDSIRIGLAAIPPDCAAVAVLPVDAPAVGAETVRRLLQAFRGAPDSPVVRPVHQGVPGHPTLFARAVFPQLMEPGLTRGAETIVQRHSAACLDVPVDDPAVAGNINTPEDYQRLVQPTEPRRIGAAEAARLVLDALAAGDAVATATLLTPAGGAGGGGGGEGRPGDRLLLREDGSVSGTLGHAALDAAAADVARQALAGAGPATHELEGASIFVEAHLPPDELLVVGAGHIAVPVARLGAMLGFRVTVLDDREEFADEARFPEAARVLRTEFEPPADPFAGVRITRRSYVVLVTRAHRYDFDCLSRLLARPDAPEPRYLGMIGSRRRVRAAFEAVLDAGVPRERLARIHGPIGLDIGAETPEEIAVSIVAEIVRVRRGHTGSTAPRSEQERVLDRLLPEDA